MNCGPAPRLRHPTVAAMVALSLVVPVQPFANAQTDVQAATPAATLLTPPTLSDGFVPSPQACAAAQRSLDELTRVEEGGAPAVLSPSLVQALVLERAGWLMQSTSSLSRASAIALQVDRLSRCAITAEIDRLDLPDKASLSDEQRVQQAVRSLTHRELQKVFGPVVRPGQLALLSQQASQMGLLASSLESSRQAVAQQLGEVPRELARQVVAYSVKADIPLTPAEVEKKLDELAQQLPASAAVRSFIAQAGRSVLEEEVVPLLQSAQGLQLAKTRLLMSVVEAKQAALPVLDTGQLKQRAESVLSTSIASSPAFKDAQNQFQNVEKFMAASRDVVKVYGKGLSDSAKYLGEATKLLGELGNSRDLVRAGAVLQSVDVLLFSGSTSDAAVKKLDPLDVQLRALETKAKTEIDTKVPGATERATDAAMRRAAYNVAKSALTTSQELAALGTLVGQFDPGAARYMQAASVVANTTAQISSLVAAGALTGPVGWVMVGASLLQAGGGLSKMFGRGGGADPNAQFIAAAREILKSIDQLRQLVERQHAETHAVLDLHTLMLSLVLMEVAKNANEDWGECREFARRIEELGVSGPEDLSRWITLGGSTDVVADDANKLQRCHSATVGGKRPLAPGLTDNIPTLNSIYSTNSVEFIKAIEASSSKTTDDLLVVEGDLALAALLRKDLRDLVEGAQLFYQRPDRLWMPLLYPPESWRDIEQALAGTGPGQGKPTTVELSNYSASLGKAIPSIDGAKLLEYQLDYVNTMVSLRVVSYQLEIAQRVDLSSPSAVRDFMEGFSPSLGSVQDLATRFDTAGEAARAWAQLAVLALMGAQLDSGALMAPYISELLLTEPNRSDYRAQCKKAEDANEQKAKQKKPVEALPEGLCAKLGAKLLESQYQKARRVVRFSPSVRANVAFWRVREHLGIAGEGIDGRRADVSEYARALGGSSDYDLDQLLNVARPELDTQKRKLMFAKVPLVQQESVPALDLPSEPSPMDWPVQQGLGSGKGHWWFLPLTGQCRGFGNRADVRLNGRLACPDAKPQCQTATLGQRKKSDGTRAVWLEKLMKASENACVMAALPSPEQLAEGKPLSEWSQSGLTQASAAFIQQAAYWAALVKMKNQPEDRNRLLAAGRPPTVPLIPLCGALRLHPERDPCRTSARPR